MYLLVREPRFYESIEKWGELIEDDFILNLNANLRNLDDDRDVIVSVRFWPFLVVTSLWLYFFARL